MIKGFTTKLVIIILVFTFLFVPFAQVDAQEKKATEGFCPAGTFILPNPFAKCEDGGPATQSVFSGFVGVVINIALLVVASVSVIFLLLGGYRYITAGGNEEQMEGAKKTMTGAIIGLVIVIMASAIIAIISRVIVEGTSGTGI